jgi:glycosyltransferase involved in cell wall biosynthesis
MRLFLVIDSLSASGGAEQALASLAPGLVDAGIDLAVQPLLDRPELVDRLTAAGASVLLPLTSRGRVRRARELEQRIRSAAPDLVHTTLYESDVLGRVAARRAGVPVVSSLVNVAYGRDQREHLSRAKLAGAQALDMATARLVTRFHALTQHVRSEMSRRLLIPPTRIDVIPRGRDRLLLGTRSPARTAEVRQRLGVRPGSFLVVSAARHEYQKGLDVSVQAVARLRATGTDVTYLVAGRTGHETAKLTRLIDELGLADVVTLLGSRDDVPDLLAAADAFVAPSRWEGLGSATLEAMALGTPVVASDVPAIQETVGGAAGALLVPVGDAAALARALAESGRDEAARDRRVEAAGARFAAHYGHDVVLASMIDFYRRAATRPASR